MRKLSRKEKEILDLLGKRYACAYVYVYWYNHKIWENQNNETIFQNCNHAYYRHEQNIQGLEKMIQLTCNIFRLSKKDTNDILQHYLNYGNAGVIQLDTSNYDISIIEKYPLDYMTSDIKDFKF